MLRFGFAIPINLCCNIFHEISPKLELTSSVLLTAPPPPLKKKEKKNLDLKLCTSINHIATNLSSLGFRINHNQRQYFIHDPGT